MRHIPLSRLFFLRLFLPLVVFLTICSPAHADTTAGATRPLVGVALNPFLFGSDEFSGTLSLFPTQHPLEIAIPVYRGIFSDHEQADVDLRLRYYIKNNKRHRKSVGASGVYFSFDIRYSRLQGVTSEIFNPDSNRTERYYASTNKLGLGVGLGVRGMFSYKHNFYFGASINTGRYVSGQHELFLDKLGWLPGSGGTSDYRNYVDIEFLKFGVVF